MTRWERIKFEFLKRCGRLQCRKWNREAQLRYRQRLEKTVKDVIINRKPYAVWGISIPANYLTEWELRYALRCEYDDREHFKRWFDLKVQEIIEDINNDG